MADTDPVWRMPDYAWNQVTGVYGASRGRMGITKRFKCWWLRFWSWNNEDGWVPKRKEEDGASQDK